MERNKNLEEGQVLLRFITKCQDTKAGEHCRRSEALRWRGICGAGGVWEGKALVEESESLVPLCTAACMVGFTSGSTFQSCQRALLEKISD